MANFEILPGLPPYGDDIEAFSETGQGRYREGFVVRFDPDNSTSWVGNFQPGLSSFEEVLRHPNGREFLVIAAGQGYLVDPNVRTKREYFGGQIENAIQIPELNSILLGNGLWFELIGPNGFQWRTKRISWDGMQQLQLNDLKLSGEAWSPLENCWIPFVLDLITGEFSGGSYNWS